MTELQPTPQPSRTDTMAARGAPIVSTPTGADASDTTTTGTAPPLEGVVPELVPNVAPEWLPKNDPAVAAAAVVTTQLEAAFDLTSVRSALLWVRLNVSIEEASLILVSR